MFEGGVIRSLMDTRLQVNVFLSKRFVQSLTAAVLSMLSVTLAFPVTACLG